MVVRTDLALFLILAQTTLFGSCYLASRRCLGGSYKTLAFTSGVLFSTGAFVLFPHARHPHTHLEYVQEAKGETSRQQLDPSLQLAPSLQHNTYETDDGRLGLNGKTYGIDTKEMHDIDRIDSNQVDNRTMAAANRSQNRLPLGGIPDEALERQPVQMRGISVGPPMPLLYDPNGSPVIYDRRRLLYAEIEHQSYEAWPVVGVLVGWLITNWLSQLAGSSETGKMCLQSARDTTLLFAPSNGVRGAIALTLVAQSFVHGRRAAAAAQCSDSNDIGYRQVPYKDFGYSRTGCYVQCLLLCLSSVLSFTLSSAMATYFEKSSEPNSPGFDSLALHSTLPAQPSFTCKCVYTLWTGMLLSDGVKDLLGSALKTDPHATRFCFLGMLAVALVTCL
ncbi:hypothetical protein GNI_105640 [Gregarina niphandrodes]|uniref:Uncharacterized protein n=1 Tax=Gregarina niphandrodes TaxID=110365 RepID=A0A023B3Z3_GRENI|nr:hypothetical protein GNI_105640 [Gregarina niphandrodes]EZG56104.1 hypothetical protein GNI_105640 [Gregarina niphandrodes]|eukprot:XP_011131337.1 hypothetical protein GNI_105640 [Gregarina niphandrodes]